jgi:hypothetical protein
MVEIGAELERQQSPTIFGGVSAIGLVLPSRTELPWLLWILGKYCGPGLFSQLAIWANQLRLDAACAKS